MTIPFSPLDLNVSMWWRALEGRVDYHPAPNRTRIKSWHPFGHPSLGNNQTFPLGSYDHSDTPPTISHAPVFGNLGDHLLNGRPTINFPAGTYLNGTTFDWVNNWYSDYVSNPRTDGYSSNARSNVVHSDGFLMDPSDHHMFCLCRVYPPETSLSEPVWNQTGSYSEYLNIYRRPAILGTGITVNNDDRAGWPAIHLQSWTPGSLAGGQLRLVSSMYALKYDGGSDSEYRVPYLATVPFALGEWVLLEWATYPETLNVPRDPFGPNGDPIPAGDELVHLVRFRLNGNQIGPDLYRLTPNSYSDGTDDGNYTGSLFSIFAELIADGERSDLTTAACSGNVAELMFFPRALNDDEAAKVRAHIMQRFGLADQLPAGAPYRNATFIPGSNPITTWSFPGLPPSSRSYTPGAYPATPFVSTAGVERQVRHSSLGYVGDRLSLMFVGLSEVETQQIIDHYELTRGGYEPFGLRPETLVNLSPVAAHLGRAVTRADLRPRGSSWSYAAEPEVTTLKEDLNNVTVELELLRRPARAALSIEQGVISAGSDGALTVVA